MNIKSLLLIISFFWIVSHTFAQTNQKRSALVIGNGDYQYENKLKNPENDATSIGTELKKLGFDVMVYTDLSLNDMKIHIREFADTLSVNKGVGLFFYSGHGSQINGEYYIIPVEAKTKDEQSVQSGSVNLKSLIIELENAQNDLNIVILDAGRNNPFAKSFRAGGNQGLASLLAPDKTIIAYSTSPGSVASDGTGSNGLYTQELLKALRIPGLTIEDIFKEVRRNVYILSNKTQVPWESISFQGDFYLNK